MDITALKPQLNHLLARLDAREHVERPLARHVPLVGAGLGAVALASDLAQAPDAETRRKVLIRDGLVLAGLFGALALYNRNQEFLVNGMLKAFQSAKRLLTNAAKTGEEAVAHAAHSGCGHSHGHFPEKSLERIKALFQSSLHDHGPAAALNLEGLAVAGILGGGLAGLLADGINGEDVRTTGAMKLKEGVFQFLGNITLCTVSILAISTAGRKVAEKLFDIPSVKQHAYEGTRRLLEALQRYETGHPSLIPSSVTGDLESAMLGRSHDGGLVTRKEFIAELKHYLGIEEEEAVKTLSSHNHSHGGNGQSSLGSSLTDSVLGVKSKPVPPKAACNHAHHHEHGHSHGHGDHGHSHEPKGAQKLIQNIQKSFQLNDAKRGLSNGDAEMLFPTDRREVHNLTGQFVSNLVRDDIKNVLKNDPDAVADIAAHRLSQQGEILGVVGGLATGVIGGAWVSNGLNRILTKVFNLPEGHENVSLFGSDSHGWGAGALGERGLHWWDGVLHLDDWPAALYMAGVHCVESMINILYGMSGFLTGTAGTNYKRSAAQKQNVAPAPEPRPIPVYQAPVRRAVPTAFQAFQTQPAGGRVL